MPTLVLLLVFPLVGYCSVIKLSLHKPDEFDKHLEEKRIKTYLYCTDGYLMRCSTFFDEHEKDTVLTYQLAEGGSVASTSVAVVYKHAPCTIYESPPKHQEKAYLFLDSCEGMTQIDIGDKEVEAWISSGKWYYCNERGCGDSDTQRMSSSNTWTTPSFM